MIDSVPVLEQKKNGLHDYVDNKYREIQSIYRVSGFDGVVHYLSTTPLPTFSVYEATIADNNSTLRAQLETLKGQAPEKIEALDRLVAAINASAKENDYIKNVEAMRKLVY